MMRLFWIGLGSAFGGMARFGVERSLVLFGVEGFLVATLLINIAGSGLLGYFAGNQLWRDGSVRQIDRMHFWTTGVCGGFTTFSVFSWHVLDLIQRGEGQAAGLYAAANIGFSLISVWAGLSFALQKNSSTRE